MENNRIRPCMIDAVLHKRKVKYAEHEYYLKSMRMRYEESDNSFPISLELMDPAANSVIWARLEDVEE